MAKSKRKGSPRAQVDKSFRTMLKQWAGSVRAYRHMMAEARKWGGAALRNLRKELGLTQREMADLISVDFSYISKVEREHDQLSANLLLRLESLMSVEEMAKDKGKWVELMSKE